MSVILDGRSEPPGPSVYRWAVGSRWAHRERFSMHLLAPLMLIHLAVSVSGSGSPRRPALKGEMGITSLSSPVRSVPFRRFFRPGPRELLTTPELLSLKNLRVRVEGFMVRMEQPA